MTTHPHLEGLIPAAVEAFLVSTGQAHTVTQLQRDLTTTCMRAALEAALAALPGGGVDWMEERAAAPAAPAEGAKWAKRLRAFAWRLDASEQDEVGALAKFLEAPRVTGGREDAKDAARYRFWLEQQRMDGAATFYRFDVGDTEVTTPDPDGYFDAAMKDTP